VATLARPVSLLLDAHHRVVDLLDGEQRLCGEGQVALAVDGDRAASPDSSSNCTSPGSRSWASESASAFKSAAWPT